MNRSSGVRVMVLRAAGINCDEETVYCWRRAGASAELVHLNALCENPGRLSSFDIVTVPGGFSYGDDLGGGVIFAQRLARHAGDHLRTFVDGGGGILGICNGFQVLVKAGLLPGGRWGRDVLTVTSNNSARFEARWVRLRVETDRCPFLAPGATVEMPIEHAEGRVAVASPEVVDELAGAGCVALRYVDDTGRTDVYPANPNGSAGGIAGLCDMTGRIFGLMPHPDRSFDPCHHPAWTSLTEPRADGLTVFENAVRHWSR